MTSRRSTRCVVSKLKSEGVDTIITGQRRRQHVPVLRAHQGAPQPGHRQGASTLYSLDAQYDAVIDLSRQVGGVDGAKLINDMNDLRVLGRGPAGLAGRGDRRRPRHAVQQGVRRRTPRSNKDDLPQPAPPAFARDPYGTVGLICAMYRTMARGLYNAGENLTQKSAIKAFEALPYLDSVAAKGSPAPRPTRRSSTACRRRCSTRRC